MKKIVILTMALFACMEFTVSAQEMKNVSEDCGVFRHLDASVSLGTTGIGIDVSSPIGNYVNLRAGFDFMPHFHHNMTFGVQVGDDPTVSDTKFQRLSSLLEGMTGYRVDNKINMVGEPTLYNFKFLVDVFPLKNNKKWHITAGFYLGSSKIAKAYNATEDMPSLMAVGIYNNMYDKIMAGKPLIEVEGIEDNFLPYEVEDAFRYYGRMGVHIGDYSHDIYYSENVYYTEDVMYLGELVHAKGDIMHAKGDVLYAKGDPYMMVPDENGMAKASVKVNSFKPYLGIGYGGRLLKNNDKYHIAVDCGLLFWGGTPSIIAHDGTDLVNDVENISGKVGDYVDLLKGFKVYPVLNVRFTRSIF